MRIKEIAYDLLDKYEEAERACIWEYSGDIDAAEAKLAEEVENYRRTIDEAVEELAQLVSFYESAADGYWADLCRIRGEA